MTPMIEPTTRPLDELGFYGLAGAPRSPADLIKECRDGEALGLGTVFLSERFNIKEIATISGVAGAVTERMRIATGVTNHNTRHPVVTASYATTMHRLTNGRFVLGLGRGMDRMFDAFGLPRITTAQLEDFAALMRRLWHGEVVVGHDGPCGTYPVLALDPDFREDIPMLLERVRTAEPAARRAGLRRGAAPHVLHRRNAAAMRAHREGVGGSGWSRSC